MTRTEITGLQPIFDGRSVVALPHLSQLPVWRVSLTANTGFTLHFPLPVVPSEDPTITGPAEEPEPVCVARVRRGLEDR